MKSLYIIFAMAILACVAMYLDAVQSLHYALTPEDEVGEAIYQTLHDMQEDRDKQAEAFFRAYANIK